MLIEDITVRAHAVYFRINAQIIYNQNVVYIFNLEIYH
jgi:hypothetical protein